MIIFVQSWYKPTDPNMAIFCVFVYSIEYILWPLLSINPGTLDTRGWIKVPFCDVMVIIVSLHNTLSWSPSLVTIRPKEILCGYVISFWYSVFRPTPPHVAMHANDYNLYHIRTWLIHLSSFWVSFPVSVIISISNLSSSLRVVSIGDFLMHNCSISHQIPSHKLYTHPLAPIPPQFL